jgi:hypothetical protein
MERDLTLRVKLHNVNEKDMDNIRTIRSLAELDYYDWELDGIEEGE